MEPDTTGNDTPQTDAVPAAAPVVTPAPPISTPTEAYDLDLDLIQPQVKKVKLGDQIFEVQPPKLKDIADLTRLAGMLQGGRGDTGEEVQSMLNVFYRLMPGLQQEGVDLSLSQMMALFQFINTMASPNENSALKALGVEPTQEKKVPPVA